jgi:glycosyltransferase involved in cell wall biosynthesis
MQPLVLVVVPTIPSRAKMLDITLRSIREQTYLNIKTVVKSAIDISIGRKLNEAIEENEADYICRCDDDVWNVRDRIEMQMDMIGDSLVCGTSDYYSHNLITDKTERVTSTGPYCTYESFLFKREAWKYCPFEDKSLGECHLFMMKHFKNTLNMKIPFIVSMRHSRNTTARCPPYGPIVDTNLVRGLMGNILSEYKESV